MNTRPFASLAVLILFSTAYLSPCVTAQTHTPAETDTLSSGDDNKYQDRAERLLAAATEAKDDLATAQAQHALARHMMSLSLWSQALTHAGLARKAARRSGNETERIATNITYARILPYLERTAEASRILLDALERARDIGEREQEMLALLGLSGAYVHARQLEAAEEFARKGLELARDANDRVRQIRFLNNLGLIAWTAGDASTAQRYIDAATSVDVDNLPPDVHKTLILASITLAGTDSEADAERARQVIEQARRDGSRFMEAFATEQLAQTQCQQDNFELALETFAAADTLFRQTDSPGDLRRLHERWAECLTRINRFDIAYDHLREAIAYLTETNERRQTDTLQALDVAFRTEQRMTELARLATGEQRLRAQLADQRALMGWLTAGVLLLLGLLYGLWTRNRRLREHRDAQLALQQARIDLLARTSHEIRNPVQGLVGILERYSAEAEHQDNDLNTALAAARMIGHLSNDYLDMALLEQGRLRLETDAACHLPTLVERIMTLGHAFVASGHVDLASHIDPAVPEYVRTDPERLTQVLLNLVSNAAHYAAGGEIVLGITSDSDAGEIMFSVADSGPGIDPSEAALFDPYVRGRQPAEQPRGSGLGLAISTRIMHAMGGRISAHNRSEGGACFVVTLPLVTAGKEDLPSSPRPARAAAPEPGPGRVLRVLIIDDDRFARLGLRALAEFLDAEVRELASGDALEHVLKAFDPTLVLIDMYLDNARGTDLARVIRDHDARLGRTRAIAVVSGSSPARSGNHGDGLIDRWLLKPVGRAALADLLKPKSHY